MQQSRIFFKEQFPYLSESDLDELLSLATVRNLQSGDIFIEAGEFTHNSAVVVSGMLRNYHTTSNGDEKTVLFTTEGESALSYASVFLGQPSADSIVAAEDAVILVSDHREIKALAKHNPRIAQMINEKLEKRLVETIWRIDDFTLRTPEQRYIRFLEEKPELVERVQQKHLASYLGITPISLSRIKARLRNRNAQ